MLVWIFAAVHLVAQTPYSLAKQEIVKQRLDFYKGNDTKREAALMQLFMQVGCTAPHLSEQPRPLPHSSLRQGLRQVLGPVR